MAKVYIGMTIDVLHHGYINIISQGRQYGDVIIGLLTDEAIAQHKQLPYLNYAERKAIVENIVGVTEVVEQKEWDYSPNLIRYKPDYMVHGDDWQTGSLTRYRENAIVTLNSYGGKLIEVPYTKGVYSKNLVARLRDLGTTPDIRRARLARLLRAKRFVRIIEAHSPLSALITEGLVVEENGVIREFDGFWSSSLADSTQLAQPDIEILDISRRLNNINSIFDVTTKPLVMDGDTGGKPEHFELHVKAMERLGISAVIIEDKCGLKKNSLFGEEVTQTQEETESFCAKITAGRRAVISEDFMIIARVESLILGKGIDHALERAKAYMFAGADGIMIHSRKNSPSEIFAFASRFRSEFVHSLLVCVPSSYDTVTEAELSSRGFNMVIYANQMIRAAYPAMKNVATQILQNGRSSDVRESLLDIKELLNLIPGTR